MEVPIEIEAEAEADEILLPPQNVKYGDTILLQCNARDDRYLTGNRDGYNPIDKTNDNFEGVYTTNEDNVLMMRALITRKMELEEEVENLVRLKPNYGRARKINNAIQQKN